MRPPKSAKALPKALSPDEANRLLAAAGEDILEIRDQAIFELFYSSGLRLAELAALDISCLEDLLAGEVRVLGKRKKLRIVPVGSKAREAVARWAEQRARLVAMDEVALFVGQRGKRLGCRMIPVSYTHLDVYKRQRTGSSKARWASCSSSVRRTTRSARKCTDWPSA